MKKFSLILIILGIIIVLLPMVGKLITNYFDNKLIFDWENNRVESKDSMSERIYDSYNNIIDFFSIEKNGEKDLSKQLSKYKKNTADIKSTNKLSQQKVIGIIEIHSIKVKLPIVEGVNRENLRIAIGHIPKTAPIGETGNCALAGHRSYAFGKFFNRLGEVKKNDDILIHTKLGTYKYRVYNILVVLPNETSVLEKNGSMKELTLITCTPIRVSSHRLILKAELIGIN